MYCKGDLAVGDAGHRFVPGKLRAQAGVLAPAVVAHQAVAGGVVTIQHGAGEVEAGRQTRSMWGDPLASRS